MESIQPDPCRIQGCLSFCAGCRIDGYNRIVGTALCAEIYQWDISVAFNLLAEIILCYLVHTGSASACPNFRNQFQITANKIRLAVQAHQELVQLVQKQLIIFGHLGCSGKVNCRAGLVLCGASSYSHIQTVKTLFILAGITNN